MDRSNIHAPGEAGIWILIAGDIAVFSMLFATFLIYRSDNVTGYSVAQRSLNSASGVLNTLFMLCSSWCVAMAVRFARLADVNNARRLLRLAIACGLGFTWVKYFEYSAEIAAGNTATTNDFFMFYYVMTGIHLLHVLIGMAVLSFLSRKLLSSPLDANMMRNLESGASFWHAVDVIWIVLFALLYLIR